MLLMMMTMNCFSKRVDHYKDAVTLIYNVTTIHWMYKIYCSFVLIYWSQLFIYYQTLSLILIKRGFISLQKSYQENGQ